MLLHFCQSFEFTDIHYEDQGQGLQKPSLNRTPQTLRHTTLYLDRVQVYRFKPKKSKDKFNLWLADLTERDNQLKGTLF